MKTTTYTCDCGCGAVRGEANHWYLVRRIANHPRVAQFHACPWNDEDAEILDHAAGPACVTRMLQQWMESQRGESK